jgi:hypothetical protein
VVRVCAAGSSNAEIQLGEQLRRAPVPAPLPPCFKCGATLGEEDSWSAAHRLDA